MRTGLFFILFFCCFKNSIGQTSINSQGNEPTSSAVTERPPQAVYVQGGGAGFFISANYDRRFGKQLNGAGFGVGIGHFSGGGASATTFPLSLNYLIGKRSHFVELAGGVTYTSGRLDFADIDVSGNFFFYHLNAGYRYQHPTSGFFLRAGISPLFFTDSRDMTSYFLGLGYSF